MTQAIRIQPGAASDRGVRMAAAAWVLTALYYFYQYALRSAPAVMIPDLSSAFDITPVAVASIVGLFYYGYSPFSLVAGAAIDRIGTRRLLPGAAAVVGVGALLFATGDRHVASIGRFLQGAGGVFALVGAIDIATRNFAPSRAATLIGATQMFGMAGGSAGQFVVGPLIGHGLKWNVFWTAMGVGGLLIGLILFVLLPKDVRADARGTGWKSTVVAFRAVFSNPQSILCGVVAGLLFIPTTIFDMIWGVRYLQEAHGLEYGQAVLRSASVPFGWIIGCPLLGLISDRLGRRKPVIMGGGLVLLACLAWILYGRTGVFPPYAVGLVAGIASGAAMLPYTVIKEANPPQFGGTATGVINFINFTLSALLAPVFGRMLQSVSGGATTMTHAHYQSVFVLFLYGVAIAVVLTWFLKETGSAVRAPAGAVDGEQRN
ncbi:MAG TPA: MFS transporter [Tepidisphaeraceae bacterium]|jgi:MFS family permease